jgi:hypothetical protein
VEVIILQVSQRVGNGITRAVEDFAHKKKLDSDAWYHNEPIWRVRSKRKDVYREVQIAAFTGERDECLFFIPQAYKFKNGSVEATRQDVVKGLVTSLPLSKLEASDENTIATDVGKMLPDAWKKAESIPETGERRGVTLKEWYFKPRL